MSKGRDSAGVRASEERLVLDLGPMRTVLRVRRHPRARRTSLRISADGDGVLLVMPKRGRIADGVAIAHAHAEWIRDRLTALPERVPFAHGARLPVLGTVVRVQHQALRRAGARLQGETLVVGGAGDKVAQRVETWLRTTARAALTERAAAKADALGVRFTGIAVRDTHSRWGSCSPAGVLSFSWRLVLAPPHVLDYLAAHEVTHLRHRGHDAAFWQAVAQLTEAADASRAWLRRHGASLFRYG